MKVKSIKVELEDEDSVDIRVPGKKVNFSIHSDGVVMVCNDEEERIYRLHKTKHGGFKLKEGVLM